MTAAPARQPVTQGWIVCFETGLSIDDGRVNCPLQAEAVEVAECLDCHFLSALADERARDRDCQIPDRDI